MLCELKDIHIFNIIFISWTAMFLFHHFGKLCQFSANWLKFEFIFIWTLFIWTQGFFFTFAWLHLDFQVADVADDLFARFTLLDIEWNIFTFDTHKSLFYDFERVITKNRIRVKMVRCQFSYLQLETEFIFNLYLWRVRYHFYI